MRDTAGAEPKPRRWWKLLIHLGIAALILVPIWHFSGIFLTGNLHEVIPGKFYRGAQPSAQSLENLIRKYKIRTVLNARGCCWPDRWYTDEAEVCQRLGVNLEDVCFSAVHLPSRDELRVLIDVLDNAEQPIFVHCRQGADRTGIVSMAAELLLEGSTYDHARGQLSFRYGHTPIGRTTMLDQFVAMYADWLNATRQEHAPDHFRHWIRDEYQGGWCDARFEKVERKFAVPRVGQALEYEVVVRNTSSATWQFRPLKTAGFHVTFKVIDDQQQVVHEGRAGMLDRVVPAGASFRVVMIVPPLARKGEFRLMVDMIEEGHCWFHQTGSVPWEEELDLRE